MKTRLHVLAAAAILASAAPRIANAQRGPDKPPAPPAPTAPDSVKDIDPVGTYVVNVVAGGNAMTTTTRIDKKADGGYTGTVTGDGIPPLPVNSVKVTGNKVRLSITAPDGGEAIIEMIVNGDDVSGEWWMANDGSKISGKKNPGGA